MAQDQGFGLPLEYQSELESLQRRRQLAQMLMQRGMTPQPLQMAGPVAIKQSPFANIAQVLSGALGGYTDNKLRGQAKQVMQKADTEARTEMGQVAGMSDPQAQIAAMMASRFPGIRNQAAERRKAHDTAVQTAAKGLFDVGDTQGGLGALRQGQIPSALTPFEGKVEFGQEQGRIYGVTRDRQGKPTLNWAPRESTNSVDVRLPGQEGALELTRQSKELDERRAAAQLAQGEFANASRITEMLQQGAKVGGGGEIFQATRKFAQALGVDLPETGVTDSLSKLLGDRIIARAKERGHNPSNADVQFIKAASGDLNTDPGALSRLISYMTAISLKTMQDYQEFVKVKKESSRLPDLYNTADVGMRTPDALFGPMGLQMRIAQELQRQGGSLAGFRDPMGGDMQGAQFQFGPAQGIQPQLPPPPPGVVVKPRRRQ